MKVISGKLRTAETADSPSSEWRSLVCEMFVTSELAQEFHQANSLFSEKGRRHFNQVLSQLLNQY